MNITVKEIHDKAIELGYAACGIVKTDAMRGYENMINKRIEKFPFTKSYNSYFLKFVKPEETEPWVKSIIVCAGRYGKYKIPEELHGRIAKYYLTDYRVVAESEENKAASLFDEYLTEHSVKFKKDTWTGGSSAGKYAAVKSGIGIVRKNNLFYTEYGSWVWLETWLIDQEMEYICKNNLPPCPDDCTKCIDACATGSLAEPYQINAFTCTSSMSYGGLPNTLPPEELRLKMKGWLYGCDDCQDCCPMNKGCWTSEENFPGLEELSKYLTLEQICTLADETLESKLSPVFFYIGHDKIWKWKVHALRVMAYQYEPKYLPYIEQALNDKNELVREMAKWVMEQIT
ncbi:MAG: epoxyqueuosine reductase [Oscillospiraceae bacterium]|nr:epoxyqueuosine reductase [Oscillospiraceae bacterium]